MSDLRLAIVSSHPIQYHAPMFRALAQRVDLEVFFACQPTAADQGAAGFGVPFEWDSDLTSGYLHMFLRNVARKPSPSAFFGCDTPEVSARIREGSFDGVLVLGWHLKSFWQAVLACRAIGIPAMVRGDSQLATPRGPVLVAAKRLLYPPILRAFSAALYVGERSRAYFAAYGFPADRLFFAPHGVDEGWFAERATREAGAALRHRLGIGAGERLLLFAGKLVDFKRPLDVVRAAARLRGQGGDVGVIVAGAGPLAEAMTAEAVSAGVPLHMAGFLNQSEIPAAYAAADILVLPSTGRETWGLVASEALACGRPIAVSDAVGCSPDLADGSAGRTFALGDIASMARAIDGLLQAPPCRSMMDRLSRRFGVTACVDGIVEALSSSIAERGLHA